MWMFDFSNPVDNPAIIDDKKAEGGRELADVVQVGVPKPQSSSHANPSSLTYEN